MIYSLDNELRFGSNINTFDKVPVGNWLLLQDEFTKEFKLKEMEDFKIPSKIYGDDEKLVKRYVDTFNKINKNMGILLTGLKGAGKTVTAKLICKEANLPVIFITQPYVGDEFQSFLSKLSKYTDKVILFIDEFEKVYSDEEKQEQLLPILDGIFETKILFLMTSNSMNINQYLKNRPNRIRYLKQYDGLNKEVINEIIEDLLDDKSKKKGLIEILNILSSVSTDVLLHIIQEMNFYGESAREVVKHLNIQVEHSVFDVRLYLNGKLFYSKVNYNPLTSKYIHISYKYQDDKDQRDRWGFYERDVEEMTVQSIDGEFEFKDRDDNKIVFIPSKPFEFSI